MGRHGPRPLGGTDEPLLPPGERFILLESKVREWVQELSPYVMRLRLLEATLALGSLLGVILIVGVESEESYTISRSREDAVLVSVISSSFSLAGAALPIKLIAVSYWVLFCSLILLLAKAIAYDWHDETTSVLLISSLVFSSVQFALSERIYTLYFECAEAQEYILSRGEIGAPPKRVVAEEDTAAPKQQLTKLQMLGVMKPYFWPKGWRNKARCFATYMFLISSKVCNLFSPIFIGRAVQALSEKQNIHNVYPKIITFSSLVLVAKLCSELQNVTYLGVKQNAFAEIAERSFAHVHSLSMEWHVKKKLGQTLRSLDRGIAAADTVVSYLFLYLVPSFLELIATVIVFYKHFAIPSLSALVFVCFVAYVVATVKLTLWRKKFRESTNKHDNDFHEKATDSLQNFETVKYFNAEEFETNRYVSAVRRFQTFSVSMQMSLSALNATQQLILQLCACSSLSIAAYHVSREELELGSFVSVQVYVMSLFAPLSFLGTLFNAITQAFVDMGNLSQLLAENPDVKDSPGAAELVPIIPPARAPTVEFRHVSFRYPTQQKGAGLRDVSFHVPAGTETAIVGKTGSGKSSMFRLLFRFYDCDQGEILISGQNIRNVTLQSLRRAIGVVPQDTVLFNETILFNVQYGRQNASMAEVEEACRKAQIYDRIMSFPQGFQTVVGGSGSKLSGGERQRVAIARCLLKDAPILVLDEFSSSLDGTTEMSVHQAITTLSSNQSRTVLVIAHRLSTIKRSDQIIVLDDGEIIERGTHETLLENRQGKYSEMWNSQLIAAAKEEQGEERIDEEEEQAAVMVAAIGGGNGHGHGHGGT